MTLKGSGWLLHYPVLTEPDQNKEQMMEMLFVVGFVWYSVFGCVFTELDQKKERMMEILEDRGLSFLFPLLRVQAELCKEMQTEPSATALFKWIKEHVNSDLHYTPGFLNILTTRWRHSHLSLISQSLHIDHLGMSMSIPNVSHSL